MNVDFMILCGGQGTRLRPLIGQAQKVLAQVHGRPFLDGLLEHIKAQGGERVILSTGFKADDVEVYYRKNSFGLKIGFSREDVPLGTGGAVKKGCGLVQSKDFFVLNGDSFCPVDFQKMLDFHQQRQALATIAVSIVRDTKDYGAIRLSADKKISAFEEKVASGSAQYVNAGVYCFSRGIERLMPLQERFSIEKDFFPALVAKAFYGFEVKDTFLDIGTPERLEAAKKKLK